MSKVTKITYIWIDLIIIIILKYNKTLLLI